MAKQKKGNLRKDNIDLSKMDGFLSGRVFLCVFIKL